MSGAPPMTVVRALDGETSLVWPPDLARTSWALRKAIRDAEKRERGHRGRTDWPGETRVLRAQDAHEQAQTLRYLAELVQKAIDTTDPTLPVAVCAGER